MKLKLVGLALCFSTLAVPCLARDCQKQTKNKLAAVDAAQADRDAVCASVSTFALATEATFTGRDYANLVAAGERLRQAGYRRSAMYLELLVLAGARPSSDLSLVTDAYVDSNGCLTPRLIISDFAPENTGATTVKENLDILTTVRNWNSDVFGSYIRLIGRGQGCNFR